jgi:hypothetical protein
MASRRDVDVDSDADSADRDNAESIPISDRFTSNHRLVIHVLTNKQTGHTFSKLKI